MKRLTAPWTTALATAALLALPAVSGAQTPQRPPEPQPEQSTTLSTPENQNESAADHLRQAKDALANIDANNLPARSKSQIAELRRRVNALERSVAGSDSPSATGQARRSPRATAQARGNVNWANEVAAIDRIITQLAGSGTASMSGSATQGTAGTAGSDRRGTAGASASASAQLDESVRSQLLEVRSHITAFAAAMSGTSSASTGAAQRQPSASSPEPGAAGAQQPGTSTTQAGQSSATTTGQTGVTPQSGSSTTGQPSSTTPETGTTTAGQAGSTTPNQPETMPGQAGTATATQPKVDAEAAKQHLTAARDTLTQLTQLPAAAQLQGDARTQVSQLIQNFNELITTDTDWRAAYEKLEGNLNALIGPPPEQPTDPAATQPTATPEPQPTNPPANPPATPPAATQGTQGTQTPGAVGTSGTTAINLDPAIKQKLVEFRQHLMAFRSAVGGSSK